MGIFNSLRKLNDNFFDGLKQGAIDRTLSKALEDAFVKNLNRGRELLQKAKESKLDEAQIEKFGVGLDEFSKKGSDSVHDLEKFVEYFRDYVEGEVYLQKMLNDDDMHVSESDKKIEQVVEYTLKHYNQLSEHFISAMRVVVLKQRVPTQYRFSKELEIDNSTEVEKIIEQLEAAGVITSYDINPFDPKQRKYRVNLTEIEQLEAILLQLEERLQIKPSEPKNNDSLKEFEEITGFSVTADKVDELFKEAAKIVVLHQQGSTSLLQRKLKIGFKRAEVIIDQLINAGVVGTQRDSTELEVMIVDEDVLDDIFDRLGI